MSLSTHEMILSAFLLVFVFLFSGCLSPSSESPFPSDSSSSPRVCFDSSCVVVEVADTSIARETGLMGRTFLPDDAGMLFVFDSSEAHAFWMKNTLIPLDAIWIQDGIVVDIQTMTPCDADPCPVYAPRGNAQLVLEVNAGWSAAHNVSVGDRVGISLN